MAKVNELGKGTIKGRNVVQICNNEKREIRKFEQINKENTGAHGRVVHYHSIYFPVDEGLGAIGVGLLVWYAAQGQIEGSISKGALIAFIM